MFLETENICSHCYHEEKLHNIDLSKMDINPNKLDSNGRACIGCNEDHLTVLCHEFLSRLTGEKDDGHRTEELINHKQSANNTGYTPPICTYSSIGTISDSRCVRVPATIKTLPPSPLGAAPDHRHTLGISA